MQTTILPDDSLLREAAHKAFYGGYAMGEPVINISPS
jgi:hypothetical protein